MVEIARAISYQSKLIIMDEPTASLDPARRNELGETLRELTRNGTTLVVTTHDDDFVRDFATRVIVIAAGQVVEEGDPAVVLTTPSHPDTKRLLQGEKKP